MTSDHVCKQKIVISKTKPKSAGISFRVNKPPGTQLARYKLGTGHVLSKNGVVGINLPTV